MNPALAVLQAVQKALTEGETGRELVTQWVGSIGGMEADLVNRAGVPFAAIPAAGVHGVGGRALPGNLLQLSRGVLAARRLLAGFRPDVLFFTGGFVGVPVAAAARLPQAGRPRPRSLLFVPDIEPGLALKALVRAADHVTATVEDTQAFLPAGVPFSATGYPLRQDLRLWDPAAARQVLGLEDGLPVLVVLGGSRGARSINRALLELLPELLSEMQIVHAAGQLDWAEIEAGKAGLLERGIPAEQAARYHPYPYLHEELSAALSAASLVISRAGASTLGELPFFGVPAILVPYPYAWRYQKVNADYLAERGAAVVVHESEGDLAAQLRPLLKSMMADPQQRVRMAQAISSLARPEAAGKIGRILFSLAGQAVQKDGGRG